MVQLKRPSLLTRKLNTEQVEQTQPPKTDSFFPLSEATCADKATEKRSILSARERAFLRDQHAQATLNTAVALPLAVQPVQRQFAQLPAIHAPLISERTRPIEIIGRPQPYELTCELCPPGFVVEDVLEMFLSAYRRHKGGKPAHLYIHWHQLLDLMARTGSCIYNGIPVHVKRGLGFWTVMGTNYMLPEEPVK